MSERCCKVVAERHAQYPPENQCTRPGTIEHKGKLYCWQHAPGRDNSRGGAWLNRALQSGINASNERDRLAAELAEMKAKMAELRAWLDERHAHFVKVEGPSGVTALNLESAFRRIDSLAPVDCVRVVVRAGGILLTTEENVMTLGIDTAFEFVMRVEAGEYYLVRAKGADRDDNNTTKEK